MSKNKKPKIVYLTSTKRKACGKTISTRLSQSKPVQGLKENITAAIHQATVSAWDDQHLGEFQKYPSATTLATSPEVFGNVSSDHSFLLEPTFEQVVIFLLKSFLLPLEDYISLLEASPLFSTLWKAMHRLQ